MLASNVWLAVAAGVALNLIWSVVVQNWQASVVRNPEHEWLKRDCGRGRHGRVGILLYVDRLQRYGVSAENWQCYARLHGYELFVLTAGEEEEECRKQCSNVTSLFFKRHCVSRYYLSKVDWLLFIDIDTAVVNFDRCIEQFIDDRYHVIHYERFFSGEVAAGSYLAKNSARAKDYLTAWFTRETLLSRVVLHNFDNGVLLFHLLQEVSSNPGGVALCRQRFLESKCLSDYFVFVGCAKDLLMAEPAAISGSEELVKIVLPLHSWMRDAWLTNYFWSDTDFVLHGIKRQTTAFRRFISDSRCPNNLSKVSNFLWPHKNAFKVGVDVLRVAFAKTERRMARYHPSIFNREHYTSTCFPYCNWSMHG